MNGTDNTDQAIAGLRATLSDPARASQPSAADPRKPALHSVRQGEGAPDVTSTEDRRLLAEVHRWARTNGWSTSWRGWINEANLIDAAVAVMPEPDHSAIRVTWRKGDGGWHTSRQFDVIDVREAIDMLVALNILPARFSSAYEAGVIDGNVGVGPLLAAVEQVIAAGQLDWDSGLDVEAIQGRAHTALIEAYQRVTR